MPLRGLNPHSREVWAQSSVLWDLDPGKGESYGTQRVYQLDLHGLGNGDERHAGVSSPEGTMWAGFGSN